MPMNGSSPTFMRVPTGNRIRRFAPVPQNSAETEAPRPEPSRVPARLTLVSSAASPTTKLDAIDARPAHRVDSSPVTNAYAVELMSILEAAAPDGLASSVVFRLKEEALLHVASTLTVTQSRQLYMRLATPAEGDLLAAAFHKRLVADRRNRILLFLSQAPRREALRTAR